MSIVSEHRKMKPVLEMARILDIETNLQPEAIYQCFPSGFQVWCTEKDHSKGWEDVKLTQGAFSKRCGYVGDCFWGWGGEKGEEITHLLVSTDAYELEDNKLIKPSEIHNRPEDIEWIKEKIKNIFNMANVEMPPIQLFPK